MRGHPKLDFRLRVHESRSDEISKDRQRLKEKKKDWLKSVMGIESKLPTMTKARIRGRGLREMAECITESK